MALPLIGLLAAGAAPVAGFSTAQPLPDFSVTNRQAPPAPAASGFTEAPRPNQDASLPTGHSDGSSSLSPEVFSRRNQYRGEGITPDSSAQVQQDRRAKPGAGINLTMPLQ